MLLPFKALLWQEAGGSVNVTLTGVAATGKVGTVTVNGRAQVVLTGQAAKAYVGQFTITAQGSATVGLTGQAARGLVGQPTVSTAVTVATEPRISAMPIMFYEEKRQRDEAEELLMAGALD